MIEIDPDDYREAMRAIGRAVGKEADGKALKRDLARKLRAIIGPLREKVVARLMSLPSSGHSGEGMREAIARQTKAGTRFGGKNAGVQLVQRTRGMPRNFPYAGRAFNREEPWTPTTLGGIQVTQQMQPAQWFDGPIQDEAPGEAQAAILEALEETAERIARNTRG